MHSTVRGKASPDRFDEIFARPYRLCQFNLQNFPCLLFHGSTMLRRSDLQLALGALRQLTDGDAGHAINDITAINDCTSCVSSALFEVNFGVAVRIRIGCEDFTTSDTK
jgi:hypothetical protein